MCREYESANHTSWSGAAAGLAAAPGGRQRAGRGRAVGPARLACARAALARGHQAETSRRRGLTEARHRRARSCERPWLGVSGLSGCLPDVPERMGGLGSATSSRRRHYSMLLRAGSIGWLEEAAGDALVRAADGPAVAAVVAAQEQERRQLRLPAQPPRHSASSTTA